MKIYRQRGGGRTVIVGLDILLLVLGITAEVVELMFV